jgi:Lar family restriction alleviation protein
MKECPFCGSVDVQISNNDKIEYYGKCNNCNSFSEEAMSRDEALENWERRYDDKLTQCDKLILTGLLASTLAGLDKDDFGYSDIKEIFKKLK